MNYGFSENTQAILQWIFMSPQPSASCHRNFMSPQLHCTQTQHI